MNSKRRDKIALLLPKAIYELTMRQRGVKQEFISWMEEVFKSPILKNISEKERDEFINRWVISECNPGNKKTKTDTQLVQIIIEEEGKIRKPKYATCLVCQRVFDIVPQEIKIVWVCRHPEGSLIHEDEACPGHRKEEISAAIEGLAIMQGRIIVAATEKK